MELLSIKKNAEKKESESIRFEATEAKLKSVKAKKPDFQKLISL